MLLTAHSSKPVVEIAVRLPFDNVMISDLSSGFQVVVVTTVSFTYKSPEFLSIATSVMLPSSGSGTPSTTNTVFAPELMFVKKPAAGEFEPITRLSAFPPSITTWVLLGMV